jgi:hypothetical protein
MKRLLAVIFVVAACSGSQATAPNPAAWSSGEWVAVSMNGLPLPYRDSQAFPYVSYDSLDVFVNIIGASPPTASVFPWEYLHFSANLAPTFIACWETLGPAVVTSTTLGTRTSGSLTSGGGCNPSLVTFDFTRKGDSLSGIWGGVNVMLIKRSP